MVETEDEWRWTDERGVQRIVSTDELRSALASGVLAPSTLVWREGMTAWVPASTLAPFKDARAPKDEVDTIPGKPPKRDVAAPPKKGRPEMQTLVGIPGVEDARGSAPEVAPIVVPHGENDTKRSAITKIPSFGEHAPPIPAAPIPGAPRLPAVDASAPPTKSPQQVSPPASAVTASSPKPPPSNDDVTLVADDPSKPFRPKEAKPPAKLLKQPAVSQTLHGVGLVGDLPKIPKAPGLGSLAEPEPPAKSSPPRAPPPRSRVVEAAAKELAADGKKSQQAPARPGSAPGAPPAAPAGRPRSMPPPLPARARMASTPPPAKPLVPKKEVPKPPQRPRADREDTTTNTLPRVAPTLASPGSPADMASEVGPLDGGAPLASPGNPPDLGAQPAVLPDPGQQSPSDPPAGAKVSAGQGVAAQPVAAPNVAPKPETGPAPAVKLETPTVPLAGAAKAAGKAAPITTTLVLPDELRQPKPADPPTEPLPEVVAVAPASPAEEAAPSTAAAPAAPAPSELDVEPAAPRPETPSEPPDSDLAEATALAGRTGKLPRLRDPVVVPGASLWGGAAALVTLAVVGFFVGRCSATEEPALAVPGLGRVGPKLGVAAPAPIPEKKELRPCYVVRNPLGAWATEVVRQVPFEVGITDGNIAVGYAKDKKEAAGVIVSPQSGKIVERFAEERDAEVGFVGPVSSGSAKFTTLLAPKDDDAVRIQALVPAAQPFVLAGRKDGTLATLDVAATGIQDLAGADGDENAPDALRVRPAGERFAFTFRRAGKIRAGWVGADRKLVGSVEVVAGSGGPVGKPGVAWNGSEIAVLFADRKDDSAPWEIRVGRAAPPSAPKETLAFALPPGGPGGDAFAPDLYGLSDGRWLLVWTEGSEGARAVRAQTLDPKLVPVGDPLALSPPAGSYGQGMLVGVGGYVAAVFLSKGAKAYELWGAVLQCG